MAAVFTERALGQLATLISQIARASPKNARSALDRIERAVLLLDRNPKLGTQRPDLSDVAPPLRTWFVPPVMLVYREGDRRGVEIVAVAHGRQLLQTLLEEDE